jgi:hypothetical protein
MHAQAVSDAKNREAMVLIMLRFGYLGKWSLCCCGSLTTGGKYLTHCALYFMSNFTLTFS